MKSIRRLLWLLTAFVFGAVALPANAAPAKIFSITPSTTQVAFGSFALSLTIKNETPNGNSNINSLKVNLPAGYAIDTAHPPAANWTGQLSYVAGSGGSLSMSNMSPLKPKSSFVMTLNLNISTGAQCDVAAQWLGTAWTGSSFSGDTFDQVNIVGTSIPANRTAVFSTAPSNQVAGTPIPVGVQLTSCGGPAVGTPVTVTVATGSSSPVTTLVQNTDGSGVASFAVPTGTGAGAVPPGIYTVRASATGYLTLSAPVTVFGGDLFCGDALDPSFTDPANIAPDQPGYSTGNRGAFNKDGSTCIKVPYSFTNTILVNDTVHLSWDVGIQANPAFMYSMNWRARPVETANPLAGWTTTPRPLVAWIADGTGNPIFVPGLACVSNELPAPYGSLGADIDASATQVIITGVAANPASPYLVPVPGAPAVPDVPFPIVVANSSGGTERMTATSLAGQVGSGPFTLTYNVTRGTVTEGFSAPAAHTTGAPVMSTPLPIIPNDTTSFPAPYTVQRQAQMCISGHGFDAFRIGPDGVTQIMYSTTVIDIGDGWVTIR
jgi:hypothetical protein